MVSEWRLLPGSIEGPLWQVRQRGGDRGQSASLVAYMLRGRRERKGMWEDSEGKEAIIIHLIL